MVMLNTRGIPKRVLNGHDPRFLPVANRYKALITQAFMRILNDSYWARANNGSDIDGNWWRPLAPSTIKFKTSLYEELSKYPDAVSKLDPYLAGVYRAAYNKSLGKRTDSASKRRARYMAWKAVTSDTPEREFIDKINVRTGRLVASTAPGTVVGGRYYAPKEQKVTITPSKVSIDLTVPYAEDVDQGRSQEAHKDPPPRPIIPDDISNWVLAAHEEVIDEVRLLYERMLARIRAHTKQAQSSRKRKATKRRSRRRNR